MATDMSIETGDLAEFHAFVSEYLHREPRLTAVDVWELWQCRPGTAEYDASVTALRESIAEVQAGTRCLTTEEFDREIRAKYSFPTQT